MNVLPVMFASWALAIVLAGWLAVEISRRLAAEADLTRWHGQPDVGLHEPVGEE